MAKSPFSKEGFRWMFNVLDQNPPCPRFIRGGEEIVELALLPSREGKTD
jgi:hypothetical protein